MTKLPVRFLMIALAVLASCRLGSGQTQGPIRVTFDLHHDPFPAVSQPLKVQVYQQYVSNTLWVLDRIEPYGGKLSMLSGGEFMEFVVGGGSNGIGAKLLRRVFTNSAVIGSHSHTEYRRASFDWPNISSQFDLVQVRRSWSNTIDWVNAGITTALGSSPPVSLPVINHIRGSHVPGDEATMHQFMQEFGFTQREGGPEEDYYAWYNHFIMHPFRPSSSNYMAEDLSGDFVVVPQASVIGVAQVHHNHYQDNSTPQLERMFIQTYLNRRYCLRYALPEKVWCFGWAGHSSDFDTNDLSRPALTNMMSWLAAYWTNAVDVGGQKVMQFESLYGVADAYEAWEVAHPGTSSFSFVSQSVNWQEYPCLRPVCEELFGAACVDKPDVGAGVEAWHFRRTNDTEVVVLWRDSGTSTVDVSSIIQSAGYRVRASESGALQADASTAVVVGAEAIIVTEDVDTDGDSLGDLVETEVYGSDPARSDTDGDGQGDAEEILAGSDLLSPTNYFCINSVRAGAGINVILSWNSGFCKQYSVDQRLSLTGASVRVASGIAATPPLNNHTVVVDSASSFYSIAVH